MVTTSYSTYLKAPGLETRYKVVLCNTQDTRWGSYWLLVNCETGAYTTFVGPTFDDFFCFQTWNPIARIKFEEEDGISRNRMAHSFIQFHSVLNAEENISKKINV